MSNMPYAVTNTIQVRCPSSQLRSPEIVIDMSSESTEVPTVGRQRRTVTSKQLNKKTFQSKANHPLGGPQVNNLYRPRWQGLWVGGGVSEQVWTGFPLLSEQTDTTWNIAIPQNYGNNGCVWLIAQILFYFDMNSSIGLNKQHQTWTSCSLGYCINEENQQISTRGWTRWELGGWNLWSTRCVFIVCFSHTTMSRSYKIDPTIST